MKSLIKLLPLSGLFFICLSSYCQSNKIGFNYHLKADKVRELLTEKFHLRDSVILYKMGEIAPGKLAPLTKDSVVVKDMQLCGNTTIKCYINPSNGYLQIDPWSIVDSRVNPLKNGSDPCYDPIGKSTVINANSKNSLTITFPRKLIGDPTLVANIKYEAWILSINTLGVKFRPGVYDSSHIKHGAVATGSNLNLGLTFGHSWGYTAFNNRTNNSYSFTLSGGFGFSTDDITKEVVTKHLDSGRGSELVLSPSINGIFARNDIGIIVAWGKDYMAGKQSSAWAYQGRSYFGLGVAAGFKL